LTFLAALSCTEMLSTDRDVDPEITDDVLEVRIGRASATPATGSATAYAP
jgi:hypothetical protein